MNNQTELIEIPGINNFCVEVSTRDLLKLSKGWSEMKKNEPRMYALCLESVKIRNTSITDKIFSTASESERQILVLDGMVKRVVDHIEHGEQLIKKAN